MKKIILSCLVVLVLFSFPLTLFAAKEVKVEVLPVSISAGLTAVSLALSLALSLVTGGMASYFMGKRTTRMKPAEILRQL